MGINYRLAIKINKYTGIVPTWGRIGVVFVGPYVVIVYISCQTRVGIAIGGC
jgi:hypothetical protein